LTVALFIFIANGIRRYTRRSGQGGAKRYNIIVTGEKKEKH
jgi:hypothetical protein